MTALTDHLRNEIQSKIERHGILVWDDPEGAYQSVVDDVVPHGTIVHTYAGSWFELRHQLESSLAGSTPPTLIAYVPSAPEDPDPLEELRAVGSRFRITLPTLLKNALSGQLTEQRIAAIGKQCSTVSEAEAALEGGESAIDARLISMVGDPSTAAIATALISGAHDAELADRNLTSIATSALTDTLGGTYGTLTGQPLRDAAFRHLVLAQLKSAIGDLPGDLGATLSETNATQRKSGLAALRRLQNADEHADEYHRLASETDNVLHLAALVQWDESLAELDPTAAIEQLALSEGFRRLEAKEHAAAIALADARLRSSYWASPNAPGGPSVSTRWRAIRALGELSAAIEEPVPSLGDLSSVRDWYTSTGWRVDRSYRRSELIRVTSGDVLDELDELFQQSRKQYEKWLDKVLLSTSSALSTPDAPTSSLQRSTHEMHVRKQAGRVAYLLVDALRYELGVDLVERLHTVDADVEVTSAIATPPSITPVGMAAVLPGADTSFRIDLTDANRLAVSVGGNPIDGVKDRVTQLEHAHGKVADLLLDDVAQSSNKELKKKLADADLVLVRSTEIDADGEQDQLAASWASFDVVLNVLQTAIARLLHAGIDRVVITADHGFLAVRQLGEDRRIDKPTTGEGELHRRAWIGKGGTASESTLKVPLAAFGVSGDLDIIAPRGLGVFTSGGGLQFFHGGLSPQELIVPVITAVAVDRSPDPQYHINVVVGGGRITTGVLSATLTMTGDLFTRESRVRLQLMSGKDRVGVVVGGDGFDPNTETIDASVDTPRVVTMTITSNLVAGSTVTLEVIDAGTGVRLEGFDVDVVANIMVDDLG